MGCGENAPSAISDDELVHHDVGEICPQSRPRAAVIGRDVNAEVRAGHQVAVDQEDVRGRRVDQVAGPVGDGAAVDLEDVANT